MNRCALATTNTGVPISRASALRMNGSSSRQWFGVSKRPWPAAIDARSFSPPTTVTDRVPYRLRRKRGKYRFSARGQSVPW
jgi:hypothetical protein